MKRTLLLSCLMTLAVSIWAQGPNGTGTYYKAADGKKGMEILKAMKTILTGSYKNVQFKVVDYGNLKDSYRRTDMRSDETIWDMYSTVPISIEQTSGNNGVEGGMWNKEHSVPQSWFGEEKPMKSDLFHVYPTDAKINGMRSNFPYGEVGTESDWSQGHFSKKGSCKTPGFQGTVFEPNDIYKGDFARTYFYMVTCYRDKNFLQNSEGKKVFLELKDKNEKYIATLKAWTMNMFLRWADNDRVSEKEINRNNAVCGEQHNRNPFIDYPGLEQYIWGSLKDVPFSYDNYVEPADDEYAHVVDDNYPNDPDAQGGSIDPDPPTPPTPVDGENLYLRIASVDSLQEGASYIIVCEGQNMAMSDQNSGNYRNNVSLTTTDGAVTTAVNENGKPYEVTLGIVSGGYTLYDATTKVYLAHTKSENKLHTATSPTATGAKWTISFSGTDANIQNTNTNYYIQYNSGAPRFSCYKSGQQPVQLYKRQPKADDGTTIAAFPTSNVKRNTVIYDLQGRPVGTVADGNLHLKKGIYIFGNRKVVIK